MSIDLPNCSTPLNENNKQNNKRKKDIEIIIVPKKFIYPFKTFRMKGDFHLYSDASEILFNNQLEIGISSQNSYKKISNIIVDQIAGKIILNYTQLDFLLTPWQYVVERFKSLGNAQMNQLGRQIEQYYEQLDIHIKQSSQKMEYYNEHFKSCGMYKYKYIKEIDQFFITQTIYDLQLINDLGIQISDFISSCLNKGIPEMSIKYQCTNTEFYQNIIEFSKPFTNYEEPQNYFLYSKLYPEGLKTNVSFQICLEESKQNESLLNLEFFFDYDINLQNNRKNVLNTQQLSNKNFISLYYDLNEIHFKRCQYKQINQFNKNE